MVTGLENLMYGNAGIGKVGYADIQTTDLQGGGDYIDSFGQIIKPAYAAEDTGLSGLGDMLQKSLNPVVNPNPDPVVKTGGDNGSTTGGNFMDYYQGWDSNQAFQDFTKVFGGDINALKNARGVNSGSGGGVDLNAKMRGEIEGGYNDYFSQLDQMFGGLENQANANTNIAQNSYNQSISDLLANKQQGLGDLGLTEQKLQNNQVKSLRDIASNIQNQYMAGNVMLGARGAGDSSAANQYSYALNRVGSKARGDVMNQTAQSQQEIENQKAKLNNIVTQETSRLNTELSNVKQGIASWLAEQQNAVRGMIAEGRLNKGKDLATLTQNLLTQALSAYQTKAQEISTKRSQLETWAMNNSTNIGQLKSNMQSIGQFTPNMPVAPTVNGSLSSDAQGNIRGMFGYSSKDEDKTY